MSQQRHVENAANVAAVNSKLHTVIPLSTAPPSYKTAMLTAPRPHKTAVLTAPRPHKTAVLTAPGPHKTAMLIAPRPHKTAVLTAPGPRSTVVSASTPSNNNAVFSIEPASSYQCTYSSSDIGQQRLSPLEQKSIGRIKAVNYKRSTPLSPAHFQVYN